jgi:hypothetical protein
VPNLPIEEITVGQGTVQPVEDSFRHGAAQPARLGRRKVAGGPASPAR